MVIYDTINHHKLHRFEIKKIPDPTGLSSTSPMIIIRAEVDDEYISAPFRYLGAHAPCRHAQGQRPDFCVFLCSFPLTDIQGPGLLSCHMTLAGSSADAIGGPFSAHSMLGFSSRWVYKCSTISLYPGLCIGHYDVIRCDVSRRLRLTMKISTLQRWVLTL